jgi:hypothetical protein
MTAAFFSLCAGIALAVILHATRDGFRQAVAIIRELDEMEGV